MECEIRNSDIDKEQWGTIVNGILKKMGELSLEIADISGNMGSVNEHVNLQSDQFKALARIAEDLSSAMSGINQSKSSAQDVTRNASDQAEISAGTIKNSLQSIGNMVEDISEMEVQLDSVNHSLKDVGKVTVGIEKIAEHTHLLSLNAAIEAAKAGEAGRGFGVVAGEVKNLANQAKNSTDSISMTVKELGKSIKTLIKSNAETQRDAGEVSKGVSIIDEAVNTFTQSLDRISSEVEQIGSASLSGTQKCQEVLSRIQDLETGVEKNRVALSQANERIKNLVESTEVIVEAILTSDLQTDESFFASLVRSYAMKMGDSLEQALQNGAITGDELFCEELTKIEDTDPVQYMAPFTNLTDQIFSPLQEEILESDERIVFAAGVRPGGYLPTHNLKYSRPQGRDPVWNNANCRNRRIFDDRTGLKASLNQKPLLLQTYRRDMGGGRFVMMKDISAPIMVNGKHWGGLRIGYRTDFDE